MAYKTPTLSYFEWQQPVLDKDLVDPPGGETKGDRYLIDGVGINAWAGEDGNIATYNGAGWDFTDKKAGMFVYVIDENLLYLYKAAWGVATVGDVVAGANLTDLAVVRGDGGAKGVKTSTVLISDNGEMTNPSQPAFLVFLDADQVNFAINQLVTILFNDETDPPGYDQSNDFNVATFTFTAPVDGVYQLSCQLRMKNVDSDAIYDLYVTTSNGRLTYNLIDCRGYDADLSSMGVGGSLGIWMDANDTAFIEVWQTLGAAQTTIDDNTSYFTGVLLC